jgi:hypothetical protein
MRENFKQGLYTLKWFATVLSERLKIEIAVIELLYQSDEIEKRRRELLKAIGERVYDLKGHPDKNILRDRAVLGAIEEIDKLEKEIEGLKQKVSEINSVRV